MSDVKQDSTTLGFAKTFVLPAVLIFLMPAISLALFRHAEAAIGVSNWCYVRQLVSGNWCHRQLVSDQIFYAKRI